MPQFVEWKKSEKTREVKVCDGWRFLKRGVSVEKGDLMFHKGKWVTPFTDVSVVCKGIIIIRRIAGSSEHELEPDKTRIVYKSP